MKGVIIPIIVKDYGKWSSLLKFLVKIEYMLNKIIIIILEGLSKQISNATPSRIKNTISNSKKKAYQQREAIQTKIKSSAVNSKAWAKKKVEHTKTKATEVKSKTQTSINKAKAYDWKSLNTAKIMAIVTALTLPFIKKIKAYIATFKPTTIISLTIASMAISLSGITIYNESKKIEEKMSEGETREPASYSDSMDRNAWKRSKYRNFKHRVMSLSSVSMPIYIQSRKGMQSIKIDFTFVSSNRYIAQYFKVPKNEFVLRDRINKSIEPVIPSFPMEPEGKAIIKKKIKVEINGLLKDLKIEGQIDDVYIDGILNG